MTEIYENEKIEDLQRGGLKLIAKKDAFCYGTDAVLLSGFVKVKKNWRIADLGSGTGILVFLIGARNPGCVFDAVEIQDDFADLLRRNVALNGWQERVNVHNINLKDAPKVIGREKFDCVVCNPPYDKPTDALITPNASAAISRFEIECTLEDVFESAFALLKNGGRMFMVHRATRISDIFSLAQKKRMAVKTVRMVYPKITSEAKLMLIECVKNASCQPRVLPALIINGDDGEYTDEVKEIYGIYSGKENG
ncbi:MAG: tRNA1(Val) (adenine(37)-N6)-methyltransferase [Clostridiales bacterium]|nr:tRNA1(Val) (adenine(37)-N6)-methyltransferase [Clostridiales bacterium]